MTITRRDVVWGFVAAATTPAWAICVSERQLVQHLKILRGQLEETGKADSRLWGDIRAALAQMKGWLAQRRGEYQRAGNAQSMKRVRALEPRLRQIEQGVDRLRRTSDHRQIAGLLQQLDAYRQGTERLP